MSQIKIIIPMYNVEKWVTTAIRSVLSQTYSDFEAIIIDDKSTDGGYKKVHNLIRDDKRFTLIKNEERRYALENIVRGIKMLSPKDEDIIVTLDGDDWFSNKNVLEKVLTFYDTENCLMTYGTYITYPHGQRPWNVTKYPENVVSNADYRKDTWRGSHLRTFKYFLWKKIKEEDLKNKKGDFYRGAWDLAFMFPMLEMAGKKARYVEDILYVYNRSNPLNEDKVNRAEQIADDKEVRQKDKYEAL